MEAIETAKPFVRNFGVERVFVLWIGIWFRRLLSVPIFYKVLLANSLIVVLGAVVGTWLTIVYLASTPARSSGELILLFAGAGIALSVLVNFVVLKAAFQPLAVLERTVAAVRHGKVQARATHVAFSDPQIDQLVDTVNSMLDGLETYRERVRLLSQQVLTAQEEERKRIARELHDETAQSLTSLLIGLRMVEKASSHRELSIRVSELRAQTGRTLEEVRKMAVDLRPSTLDDLGLAAALQWYTDNYARQTHITTNFRANGIDERLPDAVEVVVYRIVQEALTNVAKHANASQVDVSIVRESNHVRASVIDNGYGFDVDQVLSSRERGLGLFGMQERVALVGGTLRIVSYPQQPTRISISIPLES